MAKAITDEIADLDAKIKALKARKVEKENKMKSEEKKRKAAILFLLGEVAEAGLKKGIINREDFEKLCHESFPKGRKIELALSGIAEILEPEKSTNTETKQNDK